MYVVKYNLLLYDSDKNKMYYTRRRKNLLSKLYSINYLYKLHRVSIYLPVM